MKNPAILAALATLTYGAHAQLAALNLKQGADLLKTDVMGVFAHPDDETGMAATLCYYALGRSNVVANVY